MSDPYLQGLLQEAEGMKEKLLNGWTQHHEDEKNNLKQEIGKLKDLISISVQAYLSPTLKERIKRWGKDLLFSFVSLLLWFGLFFLFGKIYPPFKAFLLGQLASFIATP